MVLLPEQPLTMGTPTLDTSLVSRGTTCEPYPILILLLSPQTNPTAFPASASSKDLQQAESSVGQGGQVLLLGVSLGTSPSITLSLSR